MARYRWLPVLLLVALLALMPVGCRNGKSYSAPRFDVDILVQEDGSALIAETVVFAFQGGPFTSAFREIRREGTGGIDQITLSEGAQTYSLGTGPGRYDAQPQDDRLRITWYFPRTENSERTFTLSYRVQGLIRQEGAQDALRWVAIPEEHDYAIGRSTVTVHLPEPVGPLSRVQVLVGRATPQLTGGQATFEARGIEKDKALAIGLWFPHGQLKGVPPAWQQRQMDQAARSLLWIALAGLVILVGALGSLWIWRRYGRERVPRPASTVLAPPSDLPAGLAGALLHNGASLSDLLATLFDLGDRGVLTVEQTEAGGRWSKRGFALVPAEEQAGLKAYEAAILKAALDQGAAGGEKVGIDGVGRNLLRGRRAPEGLMNAELQRLGLFARQRDRVRRCLILGGVGVLVLAALSVAVPIVWGALFGPWPVLFTLALLIVGLAVVLLGLSAARRSQEGERAAGEWRSFQRHLQGLAQGTARPEQAAEYGRYLPYAIAFGLGERWAKQMAAAGAELPAWFRALDQEIEARTQAAAFIAVIAAVSAHTAAGAGGAAAAGAAGGGASGAG